MIAIGREEVWHRPYKVYVNDTKREVKNIHLYDEKGIVLSIGQGWIEEKTDTGSVRDITSFSLGEVEEIKLKRKVKFDGTVFVISVKEPYSENPCELYIPNSMVNFKRTGRKMWNWIIVDTWESEDLGAICDKYRHEIGLNKKLREIEKKFTEVKEGHGLRIENENVLSFIKLLQQLEEEYDEEIERLKKLNLDEIVESYESGL